MSAAAVNPVFVAIDRPDLDGALALAWRLRGLVGGLKLGLEFWATQGPAGVRAMAAVGLPIFLDLKLHDIPNTVAGALRGLAPLPLVFVTVHAGGGPAMLRAAADVVGQRTDGPRLLAITVLTSLDADDLAAVGVASPPEHQAVRLARLARECGIDGVVASPLEVAAIRGACGPELLIVTPGIRLPDGQVQDQKRVLTPAMALAAGADRLVVGRPITAAADPQAAAAALLADLPEAA